MSIDHTSLWNTCRNIIRDNISTQQYTAWFSNIESVGFANGELRLHVPSSFFVEQLEERYLDLLSKAIYKVYGEGVALYYCYDAVNGQSDSTVQVRTSDQSPEIMRNVHVAPANPFIN